MTTSVLTSVAGGPLCVYVCLDIRCRSSPMCLRLSRHLLQEFPHVSTSVSTSVAAGPPVCLRLSRHLLQLVPPCVYVRLDICCSWSPRVSTSVSTSVAGGCGVAKQSSLSPADWDRGGGGVQRRGPGFADGHDMSTGQFCWCDDSFTLEVWIGVVGVSTGVSQDLLMAILCPQVSPARVTLESHLKLAPGQAYSWSIFRREGNGMLAMRHNRPSSEIQGTALGKSLRV